MPHAVNLPQPLSTKVGSSTKTTCMDIGRYGVTKSYML